MQPRNLGVAGDDWVEVDNEVYSGFAQKVKLDVVNYIVAFKYISFGRNLGVYRREAASWTVIVYDEVVIAEYTFVGHDTVADRLDEFGRRSESEQRIRRLDDQADARIDYEQRDRAAEPAVEVQVGQL